MPVSPAGRSPTAWLTRLVLPAALILALLLSLGMHRRVEQSCGPACVEAMQATLRDLEHDTGVLRSEIGRIRLELRARDSAAEHSATTN